jgi:hypothetical protein
MAKRKAGDDTVSSPRQDKAIAAGLPKPKRKPNVAAARKKVGKTTKKGY